MRIWTGRAGSGKTTVILRKLQKLSERERDGRFCWFRSRTPHLMERCGLPRLPKIARRTHGRGADVLTIGGPCVL